jgi:hypothetical protein
MPPDTDVDVAERTYVETFDDVVDHETALSRNNILDDTELTDAVETATEIERDRWRVFGSIDVEWHTHEILDPPGDILGCSAVAPAEMVVTADGDKRHGGADFDEAHLLIATEAFERRSRAVFDSIVRHEMCHTVEQYYYGIALGEQDDRFVGLCHGTDSPHKCLENEASERVRDENGLVAPLDVFETAQEAYADKKARSDEQELAQLVEPFRKP